MSECPHGYPMTDVHRCAMCRHNSPIALLEQPAVKIAHNARHTSVQAAFSALPRTGTQRARVLEAIKWAGSNGLTDEEIGEATGLPANSVRPRRLELLELGLIEEPPGKLRHTRTGHTAQVWVSRV